MEAKKERIYWIDVAKIIAMFFIVLSHTIAYSEQLQWLYKYVSSFHVVLFFMMSGLTFSISRYKNYKEFFIKKLKTIMVPYFVFAVLFLIPLYMFGNDTAKELGRTNINFGITKSIVGIFYGNGHDNYLRQNSALWFLPCLFVVENIFYFIEKIKSNKRYLFAMIASLFIGALDYYFLPIRLPWGMDIAFVMVFFFALGKILMNSMSQRTNTILNDSKPQLIMAVCFVAIGLVLQNLNDRVVYMHNKYGNYAIFIVSATFSAVGYLYIIRNIPKIKMLQYAGQRTMSILIFHKLIVVLFQTKIKPIADLLNKNPNWFIELLIALFVVIISIAICLIAEKIVDKVCPELLGKKRERKIEEK